MIPLNDLLKMSSGFGHNCTFLFFTIFFCFSLSVCGSYHKPEFLLQSLWMAWNLTCWCIPTTSGLIKFGSSSVDFPHFGIILTQWNRANLPFRTLSGEPNGGMNFSMLMYSDHLQNLLNFGHGLLNFLFWHHFDLVKQVKFGVSGNFLQNAWEEWLAI